MASRLSPFVYWGQSKENISLKVDLRNVENVDVTLTEKGLDFSANGQGVKGVNSYGFHLDFYLPVISEKSKYRITDLAVEFQLVKSALDPWPRLTAERTKCPWLKIDFDKFLLDDSEKEESSDLENSNYSQKELLDKLTQDLTSKDYDEKIPASQVYLFVYNLFQCVGYTYIFCTLLYTYIKHGRSAQEGAYENVGMQVTVCQIAAFLEVIHALLKLVKTNVWMSLVQVLGRNIVLFLMVMQEPRLQISPLCWYLFLVWSAIEVVRYPYYMLQLVNVDLKWLTWLRYSLWIPLYPLGMLLEVTLVFHSITYFAETGFLSVTLPNSANVSFYFPYYLMAHLVLLCFGGSNNLKYMTTQRHKQLMVKTKTS